MDKLKIPSPRIDAALAAESAKSEDRTVDVTFYSGSDIRRYSWSRGEYTLRFSMDPAHMRLGRLNEGTAPVLETHSDWSTKDVLGVIEKGWLEDGKGKARMRFAKGDSEADQVWNKIEQKILRNVSMGVQIHKMKETSKEEDKVKSFLAVDWEPFEISIVPLGADPGAHIHMGAAPNAEQEVEIEFAARATSPEEATMPEKQPTGEEARTAELDAAKLAAQTAERTRVVEITNLASKHGLAELGAKFVGEGKTVEEFRAAALDAIAAREPETRSQVQMTRDEADTRRVAFSEALRHRAGMIQLASDAPGYQYRGLAHQGLVALAGECVRLSGKNPARMTPMEIATLAMTTTDFPLILAGTADASLRAGYALAPNNWRQLFARRSAPNFKAQTELFVGMDNAPFPQVPESGEFKHGSLTEGSITWKILTYGQIISFTRQLIINDNLGALTNIPSQMGLKAAMRQASLAWATFVAANSAKYPGDAGATALFAAGHSNLTNPGTAISTDSLGVALMTIRAQKDLGGDLMAFGDSFFLVVPTGKEQIARQYTSEKYMPTAQSSVNPWTGTFTPIASAELQANSTTAWYVLPNPIGIAEVFIVGYLDGNEGVYSETRQGFDIDGTEWKARMDVGFGAVDYRGAYKNLGA